MVVGGRRSRRCRGLLPGQQEEAEERCGEPEAGCPGRSGEGEVGAQIELPGGPVAREQGDRRDSGQSGHRRQRARGGAAWRSAAAPDQEPAEAGERQPAGEQEERGGGDRQPQPQNGDAGERQRRDFEDPLRALEDRPGEDRQGEAAQRGEAEKSESDEDRRPLACAARRAPGLFPAGREDERRQTG